MAGLNGTIARLTAVLAVLAGTWTAHATDGLDTRPTLLITTGATVIYAILSGVKKYQQDLQRGWTRPEFYLALLQVAAVVGASLISSKAFPTRDAAFVSAAVAAAYALSRTLAKPSDDSGTPVPASPGQRPLPVPPSSTVPIV